MQNHMPLATLAGVAGGGDDPSDRPVYDVTLQLSSECSLVNSAPFGVLWRRVGKRTSNSEGNSFVSSMFGHDK